MAKEILCGFGVDVDAVAGWLGSYGGEDSPDDISRGLFAGEVGSPRLVKLFERMGIYDKKIRLILNRYVKSKLMTLESVEKALGVKVFWTLPNNYPVAITAVNQGLSIQECDARSDIAKSYLGLTESILNTFMFLGSSRADATEEKRSGFLGRLLPPVRGLTK